MSKERLDYGPVDPGRLHRDALVVDGHVDLPTRLHHRPADLERRLDDGHIDLPRLREGGVDALLAALYVPAPLSPEAGWRHLLALHAGLAEHLRPGGLEQAVSAADVRRIVGGGGVAVVLAVENGRPLTRPGALAHCARLGVRYVTLTHFESHEWCDAATDEPRHGGLSDDGLRLLREMRRCGILIDVSHASDDAVRHALEAVGGGVIASHSSARALCDHPRNLPDDLVREIARCGGIVMANSFPAFVAARTAPAMARRMERLRPALAELEAQPSPDLEGFRTTVAAAVAAEPLPAVTLSELVDHVVHLVEVAGEEHVGIGSDFDGISDILEGFEDVSRYPALTAALLGRGLEPAAVRQVLGESFLRVLAEAELRAG